MLAYKTAKHSNMFSEAEFLKKCMFNAVDIVNPAEIDAIFLHQGKR